MKPAKLDLPTIWRGCDWGVILKWKDLNGQPINLTEWFPIAQSLNINLNAQKRNQNDPNLIGETNMILSKVETASLKLGIESWDWIFEKTNHSYRFPPLLSGKIAIKDPITKINGTLIHDPDIDIITVDLPILVSP